MSGGLLLNALLREIGHSVSQDEVERIQRGAAESSARQGGSIRPLPGVRVPINHCVVVGDSVWDMLAARRAWALGMGLASGGYGREELEGAGAYRVYQDPADLLRHLDEVGVRLTR